MPTLFANLPSPNEPVEVDEPLTFPATVKLFCKVVAPTKFEVPVTNNFESVPIFPEAVM